MTARILCLLVLILEARGLSLSLTGRKWMALAFYTQLSNLTAAASALLLVIFGSKGLIIPLRYLSTCMLVMTVFVTTCVLIPMGGDPKKLLFSGNGLYHHLLCPVVSTVSYLVFEEHAGGVMVILPAVLTLAYGLIMLYLNGIGKVDGPYPFFRVRHQTALKTVLWMTLLMTVMTGLSLGVWALAGLIGR